MRYLIDTVTAERIDLPKDMLWADEFNWAKIEMTSEYALNGALHLQSGSKLKGRFITLEAPDDEMAWVTRAVLDKLYAASNVAAREFTLVLDSGLNERRLNVAFRHTEQGLEATPIYRWQPSGMQALYKLTLRLIEV